MGEHVGEHQELPHRTVPNFPGQYQVLQPISHLAYEQEEHEHLAVVGEAFAVEDMHVLEITALVGCEDRPRYH